MGFAGACRRSVLRAAQGAALRSSSCPTGASTPRVTDRRLTTTYPRDRTGSSAISWTSRRWMYWTPPGGRGSAWKTDFSFLRTARARGGRRRQALRCGAGARLAVCRDAVGIGANAAPEAAACVVIDVGAFNQGHPEKRASFGLVRWALGMAERVIWHSTASLRMAERWAPEVARRGEFVPFGTDEEQWRPSSGDAGYALCVGYAFRDYSLLSEAWTMLPELPLVVLGAEHDAAPVCVPPASSAFRSLTTRCRWHEPESWCIHCPMARHRSGR